MRSILFGIMRQSGVSLAGLVGVVLIIYLACRAIPGLDLQPWGLIAIAIAIVGWIAFSLYKQHQALKRAKTLEEGIRVQAEAQVVSARPDRRAEIENVQSQLNQALDQLRQSKIGGGALYRMPWYMLIGPPGSGKTTLLRESGINFPFMTKGRAALKGVGGTRNCDWWFADRGILLDTAGRYLSEYDDRDEWLAFLEMLKKARSRQPINGVIVGISIEDIVGSNNAEFEKHADDVRERIDELTRNLGVVFPVYLMFTKCDKLAGFTDFFDNLTKKERKQVWGFTVPTERPEPGLDQFVEGELTNLYKALAARRVQSLGSDGIRRRTERRYTFPLQFAMARQRICDFVNLLNAENPYQEISPLRGVYFSSGTQEGNVIEQFIGEIRSVTDPTIDVPDGDRKCYFVDDLFNQLVFPDADLVEPTGAVAKRRRALHIGGLAAAAVFTLSILWWAISTFTSRSALLDDSNTLVQDALDLPGLSGYQSTHFKTLDQLRLAIDDFPGDPISERFRELYEVQLARTFITATFRKLIADIEQNIQSIDLESIDMNRPRQERESALDDRTERIQEKIQSSTRSLACAHAMIAENDDERAGFEDTGGLRAIWNELGANPDESRRDAMRRSDSLEYYLGHWADDHPRLVLRTTEAIRSEAGARSKLASLERKFAEWKENQANQAKLKLDLERNALLDTAFVAWQKELEGDRVELSDELDRGGSRIPPGVDIPRALVNADALSSAIARLRVIVRQHGSSADWNLRKDSFSLTSTQTWRNAIDRCKTGLGDFNSVADGMSWLRSSRPLPQDLLVRAVQEHFVELAKAEFEPQTEPGDPSKPNETSAKVAYESRVRTLRDATRACQSAVQKLWVDPKGVVTAIEDYRNEAKAASDDIKSDTERYCSSRIHQGIRTALAEFQLETITKLSDRMEDDLLEAVAERWRQLRTDWGESFGQHYPTSGDRSDEDLPAGQLQKIWTDDRLNALSLMETVRTLRSALVHRELELSFEAKKFETKLKLLVDAFRGPNEGTELSLLGRIFNDHFGYEIQLVGKDLKTRELRSAEEVPLVWTGDLNRARLIVLASTRAGDEVTQERYSLRHLASPRPRQSMDGNPDVIVGSFAFLRLLHCAEREQPDVPEARGRFHQWKWDLTKNYEPRLLLGTRNPAHLDVLTLEFWQQLDCPSDLLEAP